MSDSSKTETKRSKNRNLTDYQLSMQHATEVLINTIIKNLMSSLKNSCLKNNADFDFSQFVLYVSKLRVDTVYYLRQSRPLKDLFTKLRQTLKIEFKEDYSERLYSLCEINFRQGLLLKTKLIIFQQEPFHNIACIVKYCEKCFILCNGGLKHKDGVLDYEDKNEEQIKLDYLGYQLNSTYNLCYCDNFCDDE